MKYFLLKRWEVRSTASKVRLRLGGKKLEAGRVSVYLHTRSFGEAASSSASQGFHRHLWNPHVNECVHRRLSLDLSRARLIMSTFFHSVSLKYILILLSHLLQGLPTGLFPSGLSIKHPYVFLFPVYMIRSPPILFFRI
jgi:hypothetical protein